MIYSKYLFKYYITLYSVNKIGKVILFPVSEQNLIGSYYPCDKLSLSIFFKKKSIDESKTWKTYNSKKSEQGLKSFISFRKLFFFVAFFPHKNFAD